MKKYSIFFVILLCLLVLGLVVRSVNTVKKPDIILVMIDTLRADHLGAYGYKRDTSPFMDSFARENILASRAIAVAPWTPPSCASILTGLSVLRHGLSPNLMETHAKKLGQQLPEDINTLPEILKSGGYQTGAASSNPWVSEAFNFDQGFDHFFYKKRSSTEITLQGASDIVDKFRQNPEKPFFLYVHILDPHGPRTPSGIYANMFNGKVEGSWPYDQEMQKDVNLYDDEIRSVDDQLKLFFEKIKAKALYKDAVVVIVSDHGEQFNEHGNKGHGKMLHAEEVHVPFLVKCPKWQGNGTAAVKTVNNGIIEQTVSNLDVTPSILDCAGINYDGVMDGVSIFDAEKVNQRSGVFSSVQRAFVQEALSTKDGLRIINSKGRAKNPAKDWELEGVYDMQEDPFEINPKTDPALASELNAYLQTEKKALSPAKEVVNQKKEVSAEALEQIESLGYINE